MNDSWRDCNEYVVCYSGAACRNYITRWEADAAYVIFSRTIEQKSQARTSCRLEKISHISSASSYCSLMLQSNVTCMMKLVEI
jgi:chlorite dismutase